MSHVGLVNGLGVKDKIKDRSFLKGAYHQQEEAFT